MILQFALRGEASDRLIQRMHTLSGLAVTQLCASQLRPERAQRSGLAMAISKELQYCKLGFEIWCMRTF